MPLPRPIEAGLSLGSNLGDRLAMLYAAREALGALPGTRIVAASPVYETEPVDVAGEWRHLAYLNAVLILETTLPLHRFSRLMHGVEDALGRVRGPARHAPRTIDIDLLYFGGETSDEPRLRLPHPQIAARRFVCQPLADLRPGLLLPGFDRTVARLLAELPEAPAVRRAARQWR
ncbi:MAG: 2-amino-4-hydroxy-6-hydroxymethyldihydropteridine diphosphokinase [Kiritimatiellia bacterium]|jgi:2-amino-4-hydroxy-6-hydroxymethyldihydropteridine diphosphokinase